MGESGRRNVAEMNRWSAVSGPCFSSGRDGWDGDGRRVPRTKVCKISMHLFGKGMQRRIDQMACLFD